MYKQHVDYIPKQAKSAVSMVKCESTGTIFYTDGKTMAYSKEAFLKSPNKLEKMYMNLTGKNK